MLIQRVGKDSQKARNRKKEKNRKKDIAITCLYLKEITILIAFDYDLDNSKTK